MAAHKRAGEREREREKHRLDLPVPAWPSNFLPLYTEHAVRALVSTPFASPHALEEARPAKRMVPEYWIRFVSSYVSSRSSASTVSWGTRCV